VGEKKKRVDSIQKKKEERDKKFAARRLSSIVFHISLCLKKKRKKERKERKEKTPLKG
jgi:hypothetical protein